MSFPQSLDSSSNEEITEMTISALALSAPVERINNSLFSTVAPPKAVLDRAQITLDVDGTFPLFPFFPTEIRLKIWKANMRPQMLHIIYDTDIESHARRTYLHGWQYRAAWRFTASPAMQMPNRFVCQESRAETEEAGYQLLRLTNNLTEARWYNHETDFLFLDTNAEARPQFTGWEDHNDVSYGNEYRDDVLPPVGNPIADDSKLLRNKIHTLAVSDKLWTAWPFSDDNGTEASCEMCPEFRWDNTEEDFKERIEKMKGLQKLIIVRTNDNSGSRKGQELKLEKRKTEDPYGQSLLHRLKEWKDEKGLKIEVEVMHLIG